MKFDFKEAYDTHYSNFIKDYFKDFDEDLLHAREPQYFITDFQEKSKQLKTKIHQESNLYSIISEIDNQLSLDDRISFIDLVRNYCNENKRDLLQTLYYIAEIKALNEIWIISQHKRSKINFDSIAPIDLQSISIPLVNSENIAKIISESANVTKSNDSVTEKVIARNDFEIKSETANVPKSNDSVTEKLIDIFADVNKYNIVIQQLREENYLTANTLTWNHQGKGNKLILCALLYNLQKKGYYNLTTFPTPDFLRAIVLNSFNINISAGTFKDKISITKFQDKFNFIKYSEEI